MSDLPWSGRHNALPEEVASALERGIRFCVLDVRTHPEFAARHIPGAVLAPIDTLPEELDTIAHDVDWMVVCEHGIRSRAATEYLLQKGYNRVCNMVGGMAQWPGPTQKGL